MKIHKIILKDYLQFKDLEIDLTYPAGHEKAGKPLDKVCFIGQSGTGKTTLLRLIKYFVTWNPFISPNVSVELSESAEIRIEASIGSQIGNTLLRGPNIESSEGWKEILDAFERKTRPILLDFPADKTALSKSEEDEILSTIHFHQQDKFDHRSFSLRHYLRHLRLGTYVDMAFQDFGLISSSVLASLGNHQSTEILLKEKIATSVLSADSNAQEIERTKLEYQQWMRDNPNPLEFLAKGTDPILEPLGVKIKVEMDQDVLSNLGSIRIQTLGGVDVPPASWSTGIRQIIHSAIPIAHLKPQNAILLIDEPEKSLYPDIQSKVVDFYSSFTTDCQFFYATHSPIVASSFDPWEIVELKFDADNRYVIQETNHVGGRHVDNYTVYPKYLRWDRILMKLFDLKNEGNSDEREKALLEAVSLRSQLTEMKSQGIDSGAEYEKMVNRFLQLRKMVGWDEKTS